MQLPQHGFARDLQWKYSFNENEKFLCLFLNSSKQTKKFYPFDFELRIEVNLKINCLEFEIAIHNKTDFAMPINFGLHPYFNVSDFKYLDFISIEAFNLLVSFEEIIMFLNPSTKEFRGLVQGSRHIILLGGSLQITPKSKGYG